jgi:spermidine synthase
VVKEKPMRAWLHGLFALSGVSALIYELIWQRQLNLVFGVSTLAVSAVLAAFMGGLALGSLIFGRLADRTHRSLALYALLEAGIGATALLVPVGFASLTEVYTSICRQVQPGPWVGACIRFGLALVVLLFPATLIGGTLPVMGRLAARRGSRQSGTFSLLYAVNTFGAVVGATLTAFILLRFLGMAKTLWLAAGLNLVVALGSVLLQQRRDDNEATGTADRQSPGDDESGVVGSPASGAVQLPGRWHWGAVLVCAACTGAAAMGFEVAWTRILGIYTSNSAYAFALVLGTMLLGLALGSLLQSWWSRYRGDAWRRFALCQGLLATVTLGSMSIYHRAPTWLDRWCDGSSVGTVFLGELILTAGALFLPAVFMGMSFPLLVVARPRTGRDFAEMLAKVYAVNTFGGVIGAFLTGFVLIPTVGLQTTLGIWVGSALAIAALAWGMVHRPARLWRGLTAALVLLAVSGAWFSLPEGAYYKSAVAGPRHLLYYREGNNGTVSVMQEGDGSRSIMVDSQPVAGTAGTSVIDQKMLAHLPLLLHHDPQRALTVGFGSGGTSFSMTLHGIDVDCVEIERAVAGAADQFWSENHGILNHPRFRLVVDDARSWLRVAPRPYDVIVTDCTNLQYKSNGDLYTVDYFRLMKERLTDQGVAAAWVPANGIDTEDLKTLLRSFRQVFPHMSIWFMNTLATDFLIVVGTPGELNIDLPALRDRMNRPAVHEDLTAVGLADPCRLLYTFVAAGADLDAYLGHGPVNEDDRPVLSYSTYGATFRSTIAGNLSQLLVCRQDVARFVRNARPELMLCHYAASNEAFLGHVCCQMGNPIQGLRHYVTGAQLLTGQDPAFNYLVAATYARLRRLGAGN